MKKQLLFLLLACVPIISEELLEECEDTQETALTRSGCCKSKCISGDQLSICGNATVGSLTVKTNSNMRGNLMVSGDTTIFGTLRVEGSVIQENTVIDNDFTVNGTITANGDITSSGTICAAAFELCPPSSAGTPGVPGIGGDLAYAYSYNISTSTVSAGENIGFDNPGAVSSGITAGSSSVTIVTTGLYRTQLQVRGSSATAPLAFSLTQNTSPVALFASDALATGTTVAVNGAALNMFNNGDVIAVNNQTGDTVTLATDVTDAQNAYLIIERVA